MEIQFSIPITGGRSNSSAPSSSGTDTERSANATASRAGTHRFALETRARHTRRSSSRARTGCATCKKRHVKCDETKPACLNCLKWRGSCDGYGDAAATPAECTTEPRPRSTASRSKATANSATKSRATSKIKVTTGSTAVVKARPPTIPEEPAINTICFTSSEQRSYFDEWSALSVGFLSGGLGDSRLWTTTMPQLTLQEPSLRYAAMAVGALRKASNVEFEASSPGNELAGHNKHYLNAIVYYCEALQLQAKARPTKEGLRTAMLASLLFICFEAQRGNMPAALKHITHGFSMLNELAACTDKAPGLVRIAPAPPALVQEILDCYKPLELQSRSFMGSYKKFFFPPKPPAVAANQAPPSQTASPRSVSSPQSQPGTPWANAPSSQHNPVGLPSPQSQASPQAMSDQQTPPRAPPQRPPGIAPFTKHSPYFRPKQTNIRVIEDMPAVFSSLDEAHGYWTLLQRQLVQYIPLLTTTTAQLALTKVKDMKELEMKLDSVRQNPRISKFLEESRHWLQRWSTSFSPLLQTAQDNRQNDEQSYLQAINFHIEFLILYIYTAMPRYSGVETAKDLTPQYRELNAIAETLIASRPNCGFAMDSGWTWPLFVSAFGCRDPEVKQDAIRILGKYPIRNALRDSRVFRAIALKNLEVETMNAMEGDEDEQWLRLRRRELVFEDLGMNIIFRCAELAAHLSPTLHSIITDYLNIIVSINIADSASWLATDSNPANDRLHARTAPLSFAVPPLSDHRRPTGETENMDPSLKRDVPASAANSTTLPSATTNERQKKPSLGRILSLPPKWLSTYEEFITKNAGQVSQIESALRSLTYIIPGRFRDAEIASESIHSGVQLLSLYHDSLLQKAIARLPMASMPSAHARYTRYWTQRSGAYRRIAMFLQMIIYTEMLWEMTAKRRGGEKSRWKVVVILEALKAFCRLLLLRITRSRPLVTPVLPEREPIPEDAAADEEEEIAYRSESELMDDVSVNGSASGSSRDMKPAHEREWTMPRTGMSLPSLPEGGDISSYLLGRVLTADDIKPATKLLNQLQGSGQGAEILQILSPLIYASAMAYNIRRGGDKKNWTPWLIGFAVEYAARQLRDRGLRTTSLEREEWSKRGWAMGWWAMRGAAYENITKGVVGGVTKRMPSFIGGILEDYEYLWENYYFSTSA
ncbi:hypothetical protein H9Q70_009786 [Fusarium xylarioides]|nr:hypothetical protein H9Q70_009786 [Fusarium xylarioides]